MKLEVANTDQWNSKKIASCFHLLKVLNRETWEKRSYGLCLGIYLWCYEGSYCPFSCVSRLWVRWWDTNFHIEIVLWKIKVDNIVYHCQNSISDYDVLLSHIICSFKNSKAIFPCCKMWRLDSFKVFEIYWANC